MQLLETPIYFTRPAFSKVNKPLPNRQGRLPVENYNIKFVQVDVEFPGMFDV
jgi:hypothetical protein